MAVMLDVGYSAAVREMSELQAAARTVGLDIAPLEIRQAKDIAPAFEALKPPADALYVVGDALVNANRTRIYTRGEMEADHVAAWARGGSSELSNCEMLCMTHNRMKGNR